MRWKRVKTGHTPLSRTHLVRFHFYKLNITIFSSFADALTDRLLSPFSRRLLQVWGCVLGYGLRGKEGEKLINTK